MRCCLWTIICILLWKKVKLDYDVSLTQLEFHGAFITWNFTFNNYHQPNFDLMCEKGCIGPIGSLYTSCPNSESQFISKWPSDLRKITYTFPNDTKSFSLSFKGCCWPTLADQSTERPFKMTLQGTIYDMDSVPNLFMTSLSPPLLDPSPNITFNIGCPNSYYIPVIDFNDNVFQCLILENLLNVSGIEINQMSCVLKYSGIGPKKPGYYPILIEIRQFLKVNDSLPTSAIQIYILIQMIESPFKINKFKEECKLMNPIIESPQNFTCFATSLSTLSLRINGTFRISNNKIPTINLDFNWWPRGLIIKDLIVERKDRMIYSFSQLILWRPPTLNPIIRYVTVYVTTSYGQRSQPLTFIVTNDCRLAEERIGMLMWIPPRI